MDVWTGVTFVASALDEPDADFVLLGLSEAALWSWCLCVSAGYGFNVLGDDVDDCKELIDGGGVEEFRLVGELIVYVDRFEFRDARPDILPLFQYTRDYEGD